MLIIEGGRSCLYQWDVNQRLEVMHDEIAEVHFVNAVTSPALVCEVYEEGGRRFANIPNILLQQFWPVMAYGCCDSRVRDVLTCKVIRRERPADYAYTETEVKTFDRLEKRIKELEENGTGGVQTVSGKAPDDNGNVDLDASDVGALPTSGGKVDGDITLNQSITSGSGRRLFFKRKYMLGNNEAYVGLYDANSRYTSKFRLSFNDKVSAPGSSGGGENIIEMTANSTTFSKPLAFSDDAAAGTTRENLDVCSRDETAEAIAEAVANVESAPGKSAYQYAQDGGYTGTEAEFSQKMAQEISDVDDTLTQEGKAADAKATGDAIGELSKEKLDKNLGTANVGKMLMVGGDGNVFPTEFGGKTEFAETGSFVSVKLTGGSEVNVVSHIDYAVTTNTAKRFSLRQVTSENLMDVAGALGGYGARIEKNGLVATIDDKAVMRITGTNTHTDYTSLLYVANIGVSAHHTVFPPGEYTFPSAVGTGAANSQSYIAFNCNSVVEGDRLIRRITAGGTYTFEEPFYIPDIFVIVGKGVTADLIVPLYIVKGKNAPSDYKYNGVRYTVQLPTTSDKSTYNWQTGELTDPSGAVVATFAPVNITALNGVNTFFSGLGEVEVSGEKEFEININVNGVIDKKFDPTAWRLPVLKLIGDTSAMTKDDAVELYYIYGDKTGKCTCKWQGSSSLAYPKKNYTIKFDAEFEAVEGWGTQKKYCLKANYIDFSHSRNVVCAKLWGAIVKSRANVSEKLSSLPNGGAVDGFPCIVMLNDELLGLYTWNIPKDGWMMGMGEGANECILCAEQHGAYTAFAREAVLNGEDFEIEYVSDEANTEWILPSLNRMINACLNSDGSDLDTVVAQYLDLDSVIDYYIFTVLVGGSDMTLKNYLLSTYDGVKWFFGGYDMDSTYGLYPDGTKFTAATTGTTFAWFATAHRAMRLIKDYKVDALKQRYRELRETVMSEDNVSLMFRNFSGRIPRAIYDEDGRAWPTIPNTSVNNVQQIIDWYRLRCQVIDAEIEAM